jgi:hypothetical protein
VSNSFHNPTLCFHPLSFIIYLLLCFFLNVYSIGRVFFCIFFNERMLQQTNKQTNQCTENFFFSLLSIDLALHFVSSFVLTQIILFFVCNQMCFCFSYFSCFGSLSHFTHTNAHI